MNVVLKLYSIVISFDDIVIKIVETFMYMYNPCHTKMLHGLIVFLFMLMVELFQNFDYYVVAEVEHQNNNTPLRLRTRPPRCKQ